jgi:hypothetical protein
MSLRKRLAAWKLIHWVFAGLGVLALVLVVAGGFLVWALAAALDPDKDLADFDTPAQARDFVSAHLPLPLPAGASVTELRYERFTDWHLTAKATLSSPEASRDYLERLRAARALNDEYCGQGEPAGAARFFLGDVFACGHVSAAGRTLSVLCYTR